MPLFPLRATLFPYIPLRLKVFEQRYLDMVSNVLKSGKGFGVVPIIKGSEVGQAPQVYPYGTLVKICDWGTLAGGLLGVTVVGEQRFRIEESWVDSQQLMTARGYLLEDDPEFDVVENNEVVLDMLDIVSGQSLSDHFREQGGISAAHLSWLFAELAPLPRDVQLQLLSMPHCDERMTVIRNFLQHTEVWDKLENWG